MSSALAPWQVSPDDFPTDGFAADQLEFLLGYGVLAPSRLNTQPWLFRINAMDVDLFADRRRALRVTDPEDRELTISCGAVLFNMRVAAEYFGQQYSIELLPDPADGNLMARFHLGLKCETSSEDILLFQAITGRRTHRGLFAPNPLPEAIFPALREAVEKEGVWIQFIDSAEMREAVANLVAEADHLLWADKNFRNELAGWLRPKIELSHDGVSPEAFGIKHWLSFAGPTLVRSLNQGDRQGGTDRELALQAPVLVVIGTTADSPREWLQAGQGLESLLLSARAESICASFLDQPFQVQGMRPMLAEAIGQQGSPQVMLRLGYGPETPPTPRRRAREHLLKQKLIHLT